MLGLSFETCFKSASVSLLIGNEIKTLSETRASKQSETLAKMTETLLIENNIDLQNLDFLLANKGPGSFTGIRIGLSFMEGLEFGLKVKTLYLQSFASVLGEFPESEVSKKSEILVVLQAIRDTFYIQGFSPDLKPLGKPEYRTFEELEGILKKKNYRIFGSFKDFQLKGDIISNSAFINSENNLRAMQRFKWLITEDKTPFYFREALGGKI